MIDLSRHLTAGRQMELRKTVEYEDTVGNNSASLSQFLSTSGCLDVFVRMAIEMADKVLPAGYITVGRHVDITHEAPTLLGQVVFFTVTLERIEGNRLFFVLEARDCGGVVCTGHHERAAVSSVTLMDRAQERCCHAEG